METWDAIRSRRNVREFSDEQLPEAALERILEAGRRTPSSRNGQPWDFVVVTERDLLQRLTGVWQGAWHVAGAAAAIALIAKTPDDGRPRPFDYDMGQATMSFMVAAADLGIGSAHASVHDQDVAREVLGLPDDRFCAWVISLGYPADRPLSPIQHPDRRPLEELVHWNGW